MRNFYKFKFYINARHSVEFNNVRSNIHPHTWETVVHIEVNSEDFINFTAFEKVLENTLINMKENISMIYLISKI